jgi:hypothetical protein
MTIDEFLSSQSTLIDDNVYQSKKKVIDVYNVKHSNYFVGTILQQVNDKLFYPYIYIKNDTNVVSNLLGRKFYSLEDAKLYFDNLKKICDKGNLSEISKMIIDFKK